MSLNAALDNTAPANAPALPAVAGRSPLQDAWRRFLRHRSAVVSLCILLAMLLACVVGPWLLPHRFDTTDWDALSLAPSWSNGHWLGTDELGRDVLARTLIGGRVSLMVGALGAAAATLLGVAWGATAGFLGGRIDNAMMRVVDMLYAIPYLLIAILVITLFGRDFYLVVLVITAFSWMDMARIVRGQTLALRSREYVEAAHAIGVPTRRIILRHIVPNLLGVVVVYTAVIVPGVMLSESVLSFLGLGVQEPMTSWGVLIQEGANVMEATPWLLLGPAAFLSLTLMCGNYLGDGLRDAFDPR
ncbi:MAG: ABC transporter permease subunit [Burkholderiaceae bacterium]|nr:ABC transporter permease subunit [Burkholderiaceae bacterium]